VVLEKSGEEQLDRSCEKGRTIHRVKQERNIIHTIKRREAKWIGQILRRNCFVEHVIKGEIEGRVEET
jgi:hypothetical protein